RESAESLFLTWRVTRHVTPGKKKSRGTHPCPSWPHPRRCTSTLTRTSLYPYTRPKLPLLTAPLTPTPTPTQHLQLFFPRVGFVAPWLSSRLVSDPWGFCDGPAHL